MSSIAARAKRAIASWGNRVYPSFHISRVQIHGQDQFLLFQTVRGAIDIVSGDIVRELDRVGNSESSVLSEAELETLKRRGYLTELSASQEQEQARSILRVLSKKLQSSVELTFSFARDGQPSSSLDASDSAGIVDRLFSLANKIAGEQGTVLIRLEIASAQIDAQLMTRILDNAQARDSLVLPQVTLSALEGLTPWLKSENFRQVLIISDRKSMSLDVDSTTNNIVTCFNRQVHPAWKCHIDGMTSEQLDAMLSIFQRVRQKYPFFSLHLISDSIDEAASENRVTVNGTSLPFISPDNEPVLNTLWSFMRLPQRINYKPFFARGSHKLTCDLETKRVTYESSRGGDAIDGLEQIEARFEGPIARPPVDPEATNALIEDRLSCKYALVCGSNCGIYECPGSDGRQCAEMYERRLEQVLPLLFFNLQKFSRQAVAGSTNG